MKTHLSKAEGTIPFYEIVVSSSTKGEEKIPDKRSISVESKGDCILLGKLSFPKSPRPNPEPSQFDRSEKARLVSMLQTGSVEIMDSERPGMESIITLKG
jgi:hypothetical protein